MSRWKDIAALLPPDDEQILIRRYPEDTPIIAATFDCPSGQALCGPDHWPIPWWAITDWSFPDGPLPQWPAPVPSGKAWRDTFASPPADAQFCWVRRFDVDGAAAMVAWDLGSLSFLCSGTPLTLPWYAVWKWKPA